MYKGKLCCISYLQHAHQSEAYNPIKRLQAAPRCHVSAGAHSVREEVASSRKIDPFKERGEGVAGGGAGHDDLPCWRGKLW